jgi:hypothetical protein
MTNEESWEMPYEGLYGGFGDKDMGDEIDADHRAGDQPTHTVLLHRTFETYTESMWIHAYASVGMVIMSAPAIRTGTGIELPGTVADIRAGWRDTATAEKFRAFFEARVADYLATGWKRQSCEVQEG